MCDLSYVYDINSKSKIIVDAHDDVKIRCLIFIYFFVLICMSSNAGAPVHATSVMRSARSDPDFRHVHAVPREQAHSQLTVVRDHPRLRSASEANLLQGAIRSNRRHSIAPIDPGYIAHGERKMEKNRDDVRRTFGVFYFFKLNKWLY